MSEPKKPDLAAVAAALAERIRREKLTGTYLIKVTALGGGIRQDSVKVLEEKLVSVG